MSHHVIDHVVINRSFASSMQHQIRWMKSTRFSRRAGHAGSALTFAMPFGVLGMVGALGLHQWALGAGLFAVAYLNRVTFRSSAGWGVVCDRRALDSAWLYPLRDLMGFVFWCASYIGPNHRLARRPISAGRLRAHGAGTGRLPRVLLSRRKSLHPRSSAAGNPISTDRKRGSHCSGQSQLPACCSAVNSLTGCTNAGRRIPRTKQIDAVFQSIGVPRLARACSDCAEEWRGRVSNRATDWPTSILA